MKKILFAMPYLYGGGAERVVAALAGYIHSLDGYEAHLITYTRDPEKEYKLQGNIIWHCFDREEANPLRRITGKVAFMRKVISQVEPMCVVSLAGPEMVTLVALAAAGLKVPLIFSERNDPQRYPREKHLRLLRIWAYGRASAMVFQTGEAMSFFPSAIQKKGTIIQNPLTQAIPARFEGVRSPRIVTSCRLEPQKNLDLLIDSFPEVLRRFPEYTLHIYGEGAEQPRLEEKIQRMGLSEKVILAGYSNRIFEEIREASLFVLPSDYEGISNSMLEAIALGVPTIATDCPVGGARETITHGENGWLVPVGDREKMTQGMIAVLSDGKLAEKLSRNGARLREKLDIAAIGGQWLKLIEQAAREGK